MPTRRVEPVRGRTPEAREAVRPSGLPRTGMVYETPAGDGLIVRNVYSLELQQGLTRQLPLDLARDDRRTLAQIATTAFAAYNNYDFHLGAEQFDTLTAVARADRGLADRIGRQYDRIIALGDNLPYLEEPIPGGRTQRMDRDRFIDVVGATTLLTVLRSENNMGIQDPNIARNATRLLQTAITDPSRRQGAMQQLDREWTEVAENTAPSEVNNPYAYVVALSAKAIGPTHFRENYNELQRAERQNRRTLRSPRVTIATEPPVIASKPPRTTPEGRTTTKKDLKKAFGGLFYESKARRDTDNWLLKRVLLVGETGTDLMLAYSNLRMLWNLSSLAISTDRLLRKDNEFWEGSNFMREMGIKVALFHLCDQRFRKQRMAIRENRVNAWELMAMLEFTNIAVKEADRHFFEKDLPASDFLSIPIGIHITNTAPEDAKIAKRIFGISVGVNRIGLFNRKIHRVRPISQDVAQKQTWQDIERTAGLVRDAMGHVDEFTTAIGVLNEALDSLIPDRGITARIFGGFLNVVNTRVRKMAKDLHDVSAVAEIPEVSSGLLEAYASLVREAFDGTDRLNGTLTQNFVTTVQRYLERNDPENDNVHIIVENILRRIGLGRFITDPIGTAAATETRAPGVTETRAPGVTETRAPGVTETRAPGPTETRAPGATDTRVPATVATTNTEPVQPAVADVDNTRGTITQALLQAFRNSAARLGTAALRAQFPNVPLEIFNDVARRFGKPLATT